MQVEIDFDVFKALTALRNNEAHTYNEVLRGLLGLTGSPSSAPASSQSEFIAETPQHLATSGLQLKGLFLPDGTLLRADYKGKRYSGQIVEGQWLDANGHKQTSPSAAAWAITNTNVNGWRFWYAKRPSDQEWRKLEVLQKAA